MYEAILQHLRNYEQYGIDVISSHEAGQIADLLQEYHAEIVMLRRIQPVVLTGESANSFALAAELSETKAKLEELNKENTALKAYKDYFTDCYGQGYEVANYHLNGDLEPLDTFLDSAEAEYESVLSQNGSNEVKVPKGDGDG
jgi:hypothetical protein